MFNKTFRSTLTATFIAAAALVAPGCADAETSTAEQPRQFIELGINAEQVEEMLIVTDLIQDTDVADYLIYKVEPFDGEQFDRLSAECSASPSQLVDVECGTCSCTEDGAILCVSYTCDDTFDSFTWPNPEQSEIDPSGRLSAEAPAPGHDPGAHIWPAPLPEPGADIDDLGHPLPGGDIDDLVHPRPDTGHHAIDDFAPAPGGDEPAGLDQGFDQFTSDPPFCDDGHAVGQSWQDGQNVCWCTPQRSVACTLIGDPIEPILH